MLLELTTRRTQYLLAGDPHVSSAFLDVLSQSADARVRARVAEHGNTALRTLFKLIEDENAEVRQNIAFNPKTTLALLLRLAEDGDADVRYSIAENAMLPQAVLQTLSADENPYVADRAFKTLSRLMKLNWAPQAA